MSAHTGKTPPRPVLGTAQLGLDYGIANRRGALSDAEAAALIAAALEAGIDGFDTARAYGLAEERLGLALAGVAGVRVITKLSPLSEIGPLADEAEVARAADESLARSAEALRLTRLDTVLLHRAGHFDFAGGAAWKTLRARQQAGDIVRLGASVQTPGEAMRALEAEGVSVLQLPFNLLDWRWRAAGIPAALAARPDIEVHVRSVYLQGLLAQPGTGRLAGPRGLDAPELMRRLTAFSRETGRASPADLALGYVRAQNWIDGIVIGLEAEEQLKETMAFFARPPLAETAAREASWRLPHLPETLLNPARWRPRAGSGKVETGFPSDPALNR